MYRPVVTASTKHLGQYYGTEHSVHGDVPLTRVMTQSDLSVTMILLPLKSFPAPFTDTTSLGFAATLTRDVTTGRARGRSSVPRLNGRVV